MLKLKHIDVLSTAKIVAVLCGIVGIVIAAFILIFASAFSSLLGRSGIFLLGIGVAILIVVPALSFAVGFIAVAVEAWLYNVIAGRFGGIKVDLRRNKLLKIDPISAAKLYAIAAAIVGFVVGIIVAIVGFASGSAHFALFGIAGIVLFPIFFGVVCFVTTAISAIIYNYIAPKVGSVMVWFKGRELRRIGVLPYAKINAIFGAIWGLVRGVIYAIGSLVPSASTVAPSLAQRLGLFSIVFYPAVYCIVCFVVAIIMAWLYNALAPKIGGARLDLR